IVKVNNRKLLNSILDYVGVKKEKWEDVIISIDKLEKIGAAGVKKELEEKNVDASIVKKLVWILKLESLGDIQKVIGDCEGMKELEELFGYVRSKDVIFDACLARGLSYYTGTVFEAFLRDSNINSSAAGGGRYDEMIGNFVGGSRKIAAVGVSFGLSVIMKALDKKESRSVAKVYVVPIGKIKAGLKIVKELRDAGVNADIDLIGRGVSKNLNYVNSFGIPYVAFVGEKEIKAGKIKLRDMKTGKERMINVKSIVRIVSS
ncbi:MAG: ATP phosphoribosyltransferase regulatory subunit, partial [Nanoarchaeota archaeon]|nr:ATP phosphoribosyltransferase regulatory subunit [Nanoarchaeota archaeon]